MKRIKKNELFKHFGSFLKSKGIELSAGPYTERMQQGCNLLTDAINLSQSGLERARTEAEKKLDQMRQLIHEKTAPKSPRATAAPAKPKAPKKRVQPKKPAAKAPAAPAVPAAQP
jgi:hypothetical protein